MEAERAKADYQQVLANIELEEAKTIAGHLRIIREENHFSRDFRKALGIQNGQ
jgi:hypothetical protein